MSQARSTSTLGAELERDRLEHRVNRIAVAITVLRERAREDRPKLGGAPVHIRQAIADFEAQLAAMNARLGDLAHGDEPRPSRTTERVR